MLDTFLKSAEFLEKHLKDPMMIDDIAEAAHVSQRQLLRYYQSLLNTSIKNYVKERRLTHASLDLVQTDKRVTDIAFDYQFNSIEGFIRAFHKAFGKSPTQYRKNRNLFTPAQLPSVCETALDLYHHHSQYSGEKVKLPFKTFWGLPLHTNDEGMPTNENITNRTSTAERVIDRLEDSLTRTREAWIWEVHFRQTPFYPGGNNSFMGVELPENIQVDGLNKFMVPSHTYLKFIHQHMGQDKYRTVDQMRISSHIIQRWLQKQKLFLADQPILTRANLENYNGDSPSYELYIPFSCQQPKYGVWWK